MAEGQVMVIACGAIARELVRIRDLNGWDHVRFQCLPAKLHNTPGQIPGAVREMVDRMQPDYDALFVGYADCGTAGALDRALEGTGVERIPGAHCYEFFAGSEEFFGLADEEPGSFYLTDFLVRHFDRLVFRGLGLDRHPELAPSYFSNYRRVVYLAQTESSRLRDLAAAHAERLGLEFVYHYLGDEPLAGLLKPVLENPPPAADNEPIDGRGSTT